MLAIGPTRGSEWRGAWDDLERLQALAPGSEPARRLEAELSALASSREREARKVHDAAEGFRARVLAAQLARFRGAAPRPLAAPPVALDFGPREARFAAEVLVPGTWRAQAALAALADPADPRGSSRRALAHAVAREEFAARRLEGATALAARLAQEPDDTAAVVLWLSCQSLSGRTEEARRAIAELPASIELALLESELALARQEPGAARRALGRALALGSSRAALELAWRDLEEGQAPRAAELAAGCLRGSAPAAGVDRSRAWRCFALAHLPPHKADSDRAGETHP